MLDATRENTGELEGIRESILSIHESLLSGDMPILTVQFSKPEFVPEALKPRALPLQETRAGVLSSFSMDSYTPKLTSPSALSALHVWWNGEAHYLDLFSLTQLSLASLWPAPIVTLHEGLIFKRSERVVSAVSQSEENPSERRAKVTVAKSPQGGKGDSVFSDTDLALKQLGEQYRLGNILSNLFRGRFVGKSGGTKAGKGKEGSGGKGAGGANSAMPKPKGPGFLESLAGWARWHSPLSKGLAKEYGERMSLVDKLISRGDIDSALKLALKLGGATKKIGEKSRFPFRLPDMRSGLDFDVSGGGFSMPILGLQSHHELTNRYNALAKDLEKKGDFTRAAYIRSQLLDNHLEGVLTLERGELYEQAAKLALDSRQEPSLIIRLYYKAGKKDVALALARRANCFDRLVEDSRSNNNDPKYHAYVVKAWTDALLAAGQPLRALEATDELAKGRKGQAPDPVLLAERHRWLSEALETEAAYFSEGSSLPRPELLIRVLLTARWDGSDLTTANLANFPNDTQSGDNQFARAISHFEEVMRGENSEILRPMLALFSRYSDRQQIEQSAFWGGPARVVIDSFARNFLAHGSQNLLQKDMQSLRKLVQTANLPVLAHDLGKIKAFNTLEDSAPEAITLAAPRNAPSAKIEKACLLSNGSMVIWYATDRLELRNAEGHILWTRQVSQVKDLIPLGTSPSVMVVQKWGEFETRLTRFETHKRRFTDIGIVHLVAWHDVISDGQWLLQIDNQVGAIAISELCNSPPELKFLWSVETNNEMKIMAFLQSVKGPSWLTRNTSAARLGVMQVWNYSPTGDLETRVCVPRIDSAKLIEAETHWQWSPTSHSASGFLGVLGFQNSQFISFDKADLEGRKKAIHFAQERIRKGFQGDDRIQICDFHRLGIVIHENTTLICTPDVFKFKEKFTVVCEGVEGLRLLARGTHHGTQKQTDQLTNTSHLCLCTDDTGRLIRVDTKARRTDIF